MCIIVCCFGEFERNDGSCNANRQNILFDDGDDSI